MGYYEPSKFEEKCEELMDMLRSHVTDEIKIKMKEIVDNYDAKVLELESEKRKYNFEVAKMKSQIESEVRKERLSKLLEPLKFHVWSIKNNPIKKPKCDKCDSDRYIHFKSPSGKDYIERCECACGIDFYEPRKEDIVELGLTKENGDRLIGWYSEKQDHETGEDYYVEVVGHYVEDKIYKGQPYEEISDPCWDVYFRSEEEAQKYADWLNEKMNREKEKQN